MTETLIAEFKKLTMGVAMVLGEIPKGIPSGHLYAQLMGGVGNISLEYTLDVHNEILATLERSELITVKSHYITPTAKLLEICKN